MKKNNLIFLSIIFLIFLSACSSNKKVYEKQVWTLEELKQVNKKDNFKPKKPKTEKFILVASPDNKKHEKPISEMSKDEINNQSIALFKVLSDISTLKTSIKATTESGVFIDPVKQKEIEDIKKVSGEIPEESVDFSKISLEMADNPNEAAIKIEYKYEYINPRTYSQNGIPGMGNVSVYSTKLELTAYNLQNGEKIAAKSFINAPGKTISLTRGASKHYMHPPSFDNGNDGAKNKEDLLYFLYKIQNH